MYARWSKGESSPWLAPRDHESFSFPSLAIRDGYRRAAGNLALNVADMYDINPKLEDLQAEARSNDWEGND